MRKTAVRPRTKAIGAAWALAAALVLGTLAYEVPAFSASGGGPSTGDPYAIDPSAPPYKQKAAEDFQSQRSSDIRNQRALPTAQALATSCPVHFQDQPITTRVPETPFPQGQNIITTASVTDQLAGVQYQLYTGATGRDPEQGTLYLRIFSLDPCAGGGADPGTVLQFQDPQRRGPLRLTSLSTSAATLLAGNGAPLTFNIKRQVYTSS